MIQIDWGLLKMQYEILGIPIEDLAEEYQIAPRVLKYAAEEKGWKQSAVAASAQEYTHVHSTDVYSSPVLRNVPQLPGHPNPDLPPDSPERGRLSDPAQRDLMGKEELTTAINENQSLLRSVKQATLSPKYIILESSLLGKCISLISQLPSDDPTVAPALKHICDIYKTLTETNVSQPKPAAEHSAGSGMTLNIMNRVAVTEEGKAGEASTLTVQVNGESVGEN